MWHIFGLKTLAVFSILGVSGLSIAGGGSIICIPFYQVFYFTWVGVVLNTSKKVHFFQIARFEYALEHNIEF